jgi:hypothetical protein
MENNTINAPESLQTEPYFKSRSFGEVVEDGRKEPARRKIAGSFLIEDTNTFFYSRPNMGKSIFAFEIAYSAAMGISIDPCTALCNECEPMKTLVVDLEMDEKTLFDRHGKVIDHADPELLKNLVYLHEKIDQKILTGFDLLDRIEEEAVKQQAKLVIIDNISKLLPDSLNAENVSKVIDVLKRIRQKTRASFLVIGHTVKSQAGIAISNNSYFGSSAFERFFTEIFYLDATKHGSFFLCQAKSKQAEQYTDFVPVFTRGDHPIYGLGFSFERICSLSEVQLPLTLLPERSSRKANVGEFQKEIIILEQAGIKRNRIADMFNVARSTITRILEPVPW